MSSRSFKRERARENRRQQRRAEQRARRIAATGALVGASALFGTATANAHTFTVDNPGDTTAAGACDPGIANDCSLRQAIDDANANGTGADVVALSSISGTITLTQGQIDVTGDVNIQGPGAGTLTISGDANNDGAHDLAYYGTGKGGSTPKTGDSRIFEFGTSGGTPAGVTASVSGLTISGGTSGVTSKYSTIFGPHNKYYGNSGGAIVGFNSTVTISHVTMTDNQATSDGAAVAMLTAGTPTTNNLRIADSHLNGNEAYGGGGAVYVGGATGDLTVTNSSISGNQTDGEESTAGGKTFKYSGVNGLPGPGGGILAHAPNGATISGSTISNNTAADHPASGASTSDAAGGGLYLSGNGPSSFQITTTAITGNSGLLSGGGAFIGNGDATITGSTIAGNSLASGVGTSAKGGGLISQGDLQLSGSTISGNQTIATQADQGTGGGLYWTAPGSDMGLQVTNSTISGNHSTGPGGGALISPYGSYNSGPPPTHTHSGPVTIQSSTIASNAASAGGGVYDQARSISGEPPPVSTLSSTILAGNSPAELGANADSSGFAAGNSLIQTSVSGIPFTETPAGSNVIGADPQLGPLEDNGGPTETMLPGAGSPAIDAGVANGLSTDQRGAGFGRTADDPNVANHAGSDGTDIGSVEAPLNAQPGGPPGTPVPHRKKCKKKKRKHGHKSARAAKKCKKHKKKK